MTQLINIIKTFLAKFYFLLLAKKLKNAQSAFNGFFTDAKSALIVFPENENDLDYALKILNYVLDAGIKTTILLNEQFVGQVNASGSEVITYTNKDQNFLMFPSDIIKEKLMENCYGITIDLNIIPSIYAINCVGLTQSNWKVGFCE